MKEEGRRKREEGRGNREAFVVRGAWLASFLCSSLLKDARTVKKYFLHSLRCSGSDYSVLFPLSYSPNIPQHLLNPPIASDAELLPSPQKLN
ncbi:hypothetical protein IQ269_13910 [Tychonema sp. LEGE 07199]|uniref:hypothetical protein n=1 Tax=unclassified Tychonema TaxID=2642144 RepID=UPI0018808D9E|nr:MULTISPECIES: hypothetical protein [unclassified Tychonema]MBE9121870.1 hypothetical protein [Tychonema sp. LEGE 07199]MBE9134161.1 hypothetical protein [Tychonema sp. LEGE 07196]